MLSQNEATQTSPQALSATSVETRFGSILIDPDKAVRFERGMLGMPDKTQFVLAPFPSEKMKQFTLLQSLDDQDLSFITLPLPRDNSIISAKDVAAVCDDLQIDSEQLLLLLVVSVHRSPTGVKLSANARAPLFVDAKKQIGMQHVFQNEAYNVQHQLT